jgi:electron transfer flavoprotein alpha/beta subunit
MAHYSPEPIDYPKVTRVVYDKATGRIVHTHQVMALPGAEIPSGIDIDAQARSLASRISGQSEEELDVLNVQPGEARSEVAYAVDLGTHRLIEISTEVAEKPQFERPEGFEGE